MACQIQNAADALHVAGEGGQALLDALFVADIHEVFLKVADDAALMGGNQKPYWAMALSRPAVLQDTVLPPVLGPVMTSVS